MENTPNPARKKGYNTGLIVLVLAVVIIIAGALWYAFAKTNGNTNNTNTDQVGIENTNNVLNTNANTNSTVNINTAVNSNTNSTVDTSDWLKYTNEEYGFKVSYSPYWSYEQSSVVRNNFKYESFAFIPSEDAETRSIRSIRVYNKLEDLANGEQFNSLGKWIESQNNDMYSFNKTDYLKYDTYEGYWPSSVNSYYLFTEKGGRIYNITFDWVYPDVPQEDDDSRPVFNIEESGFLSTFELL